MTIQETVSEILKLYPEARKSDQMLVLSYWNYQLNKKILKLNELKVNPIVEIKYSDTKKLISPDSITRAKRRVLRDRKHNT